MSVVVSVIWTLLTTTNAWADNDTIWRTVPGGTGGRECNPLGSGGMCFWAFDSVGPTYSPALIKFGGSANRPPCLSVNFRLWVSAAQVPVVDLFVCHDDTDANCEQMEGTNRRTGSYGDITLDTTDWGAINASFGRIKADVTTDSTCTTATCAIIAECGN